jgi:16S rRNA (uracil1498-N3)-methyltransferase
LREVRCYCQNIKPGLLQLDLTESHHIAHVLRLNKDTALEVFDGKGTLAEAIIAEITRKTVTLEIGKIQNLSLPRQGRIIIAASLAKARRFDQLITQCTELGADHIAAVIFERTVKLSKGASTQDRYRKLIISAAKQSHRLFLPQVTGPADLAKILADLKKNYPSARLIFGGLTKNAIPLAELNTTHSDTIAFIGPEGGLTEDEQNLFKENSALEVSLGKNILRIETAAVALTAVLAAERKN